MPVATLSFFAGLLTGGGGSGLIALSAILYPTFMRSTGIGWGLGWCRVGSSIGPLLIGALFGAGWSADRIFLVLGLIALLDAAVVLCLGANARHRRALAAAASA